MITQAKIQQKIDELKNKKQILKDEIWLCKLPTKDNSKLMKGTRPCLVVSNSVGNYYGGIIKVMPITSSQRKGHLPTHVRLNKKDTGLKMDSYLLCEQEYTLEEKDFEFRIGCITENYYDIIDQAIYESLRRY